MTDPTTETSTTTENVCYRHPNRETFVKCQRCGRPICGQCQTIAPVGVHCPECVREGRQASSRPITTRVARAVAPGSSRPIVTWTLIAINVIVFIAELLTGNPIMGNGSGAVADALYFSPGDILYEPWTIITSAFVHANLIHIGLNMYSLFVLGAPLERYLGRIRYLVLYFIGAIGSSVGVELLSQDGALGASGAIFALLGFLVIFAPRVGFNRTWLVILGVINLGYGFVDPTIAWQGHLGGLVVGLLIGALLYFTRAIRRHALQVAGLIVLPIVLLITMFIHAVLTF